MDTSQHCTAQSKLGTMFLSWQTSPRDDASMDGAVVAAAGGSSGLEEKEEVATRTSHCHQHLPSVGMVTSPGSPLPSPCAMSRGTKAGREIGQEAVPGAVVGSVMETPPPATPWFSHGTNVPSAPPPLQFVC